MADPELNVKVGASVAAAVSGLQKVAEEVKNLTAPIREVNRAFSEIGEATGITYAITKITELVDKMAEVGEHAVNMGTALGMSAEQFQTLNEAMGLVGASGDALMRTERMLARTAETAIAQPISHQADAYNALFKGTSITAHQFAETLRADPIAAMKELADAAVRTGNTALTGPLGWVLGGRGADPNILRWFAEGSGGIDKFIAKAKELGAPSQDALEHMEKLAQQIHDMTTAMENFAVAVGEAVSGPLSGYLKWLTESISLGTQWLKGLPEPGPGAAGFEHKDIAGATEQEMRTLDVIRQRESRGDYMSRNQTTTASGAYQIINETWRRWAGALGFDTERYPTAISAPNAMQDMAALYGLRKEGLTPWSQTMLQGRGAAPAAPSKMELPDARVQADTQKKVQQQQMQDSIEAKRIADEKIKDIDRVTKAQLAQLDFEKTAAGDDAAVVHQIEQQKLATVLEAEASKKAVIEGTWGAVRTALEHEHDLTTEIINVQNQAMRVDQQYHKEAVEGEVALLEARIRGLEQAEAADLKQVEREHRIGDLSIGEAERRRVGIVKVYEEMVQEILGEEQKLATGIPGLQRRITTEQTRQVQDASQKTTDAQTDAHDQIQKSAKDMADGISHSLSGALTGIITGRQTIGQAGRQLGEEAMSKIMDTVMDKTVGRLIQNAIANLLQQLAGDAANTGILATLLSLIYTKPEVAGTTFAMGGIVPSAAGGWVVPSFQSGGILAQLHANEMVLPSHISQAVQNMAASGGGSTINIHAIDTQSGGQFLMRNAGSVGQAALRYSNVSPRAVSAGGGRFP